MDAFVSFACGAKPDLTTPQGILDKLTLKCLRSGIRDTDLSTAYGQLYRIGGRRTPTQHGLLNGFESGQNGAVRVTLLFDSCFVECRQGSVYAYMYKIYSKNPQSASYTPPDPSHAGACHALRAPPHAVSRNKKVTNDMTARAFRCSHPSLAAEELGSGH